MALTRVPGNLIANTGVVPGTYTNTTIRVDAQGRIVYAANGQNQDSAKVNTAYAYALAAFDKANSVSDNLDSETIYVQNQLNSM